MAAGEGLPVGASRAWRLDPRNLPVCFAADDRAADGHTRFIEIDRDRVLLMRTVRGVQMRFNLPLSNFLGVAVRVLPGEETEEGAVAIVLEHRDAAFSVPLHVADETDHVIADWQLWGNVLRRKLLIADGDGSLREAFDTMGMVMLGELQERRVRRTALRQRRPKMYRRRTCRRALEIMPVHSGEREIIARN